MNEYLSKIKAWLKTIKRSQIQSILVVVMAVALAVSAQVGAINATAGLILAALAGLAAAIGRALTVYTDSQAVTWVGVLGAAAASLLSYDDLLPASVLAWLSIASVALMALGRSLWGDKFPPLNGEEGK